MQPNYNDDKASFRRRELYVAAMEEEKQQMLEKRKLIAERLAAKKAATASASNPHCQFCGKSFNPRGLASHEKHCKGKIR